MEHGKQTFHILAVLDGGRRFAKKQGILSWKGHQAGYETFKTIVGVLPELGVTHFTAWVLSVNNIKNRSQVELQFIFKLLDRALSEIEERVSAKKIDFSIRFIGEHALLPDNLVIRMESLERLTRHGYDTLPTLTLLVAYDGSKDILRAGERLFSQGVEMGQDHPEYTSKNLSPLERNQFLSLLSTRGLPDIDLMIRTGGEPHLSEGLPLILMPNTHMYFTETLWPEFTVDELYCAIRDFRSREQRRGA